METQSDDQAQPGVTALTHLGSTASPEMSASGGIGAQQRLLMLIAAALLVMALLWRLTVLMQWSWFQDDWIYLRDATEQPFVQYVFQSYNGHLMPGQFLIFWSWVHLSPLQFGFALVTILMLAGMSLAAWAALLHELFGRQLWALLPLTVLCLSPVFLPTTLWTAAALQTFTLQTAMGASLLFAVRWWRTGRTRPLVLMAVTYCLGLFFWQKALLVTIPVIGVLVFLNARRDGQQRRRLRGPLMILAAISAAYLVAYVVLTATDADERPGLAARTPTEVFDYFRTGLLDSALPAIVGGPWDAQTTLLTGSPSPTPWQELLLLFGCVLVTIGALMYRRGAAIPLCTALIYVVLAWGMLLLSNRYTSIGVFGILDARYVADSVAVSVLMATLSLFPLRGESLSSAYRFPITHTVRRWMGLSAAAAAAMISISALYTNARVWDQGAESSPKPWVDSASHSLQQVGARALYDSAVPDVVALGWAFPEVSRLSRLFSPLQLPVAFNQPSERLLTLDEAGRATWADIGEGFHSMPGPVSGCGYLIKPGETAFVPMNSPAYFWDWGVKVNYLSDQGGVLRIKTNDRWSDVPIPPGVGQMQTVIADAASAVLLSSEAGSGPICVDRISFGEVHSGPAFEGP